MTGNVSDVGSGFQGEDNTGKSPDIPGWSWKMRGK